MTPTLFAKAVFKSCTLFNHKEFRWTLKQKFPATFFLPHMRRDEYLLFKKTFAPAKTILEYGSGGSTVYLLNKGKTVFSVESNQEFYKYMNTIELVKQALNKNLFFFFVNLGDTNQWGRPISEDGAVNSADYYALIWDRIDPSLCRLDEVLIDGRFRIACCLYTILKLQQYQWTNTQIVIHDFWRRKKYHVVLEFLDEVVSARDLAVFRMKKNIDAAKVKDMIEQYSMVAA